MSQQALNLYIRSIDHYIEQLSPAQLRRLKTHIGRSLLTANRQRIRTNTQPDGSAMTPRAEQEAHGRPLKPGEHLKAGQPFIYLSGKHAGRLRRLKNIKTAASAAKKTRPDTAAYDPQYEWGYELETGGVSKFNRNYIRLPDNRRPSRLKTRMFTKIHRARYLQSKIHSSGVAVKFISGLTAWIAAAHQYGEDNRPERTLLGFSNEDLQTIEQLVISHLAAKQT